MGHAFNHTLIDILIRHSRMIGKRTLWQGGTDHAGIATQMLVERKLAEENLSQDRTGKREISRESLGLAPQLWKHNKPTDQTDGVEY